MNNKLKVLLSVVAMSFVMVGCGSSSGGGSSAPAVDNSTLADGENQYGYFGENVIFVNSEISKVSIWSFYNHDDNLAYAIYARFYADGDGYMRSPNYVYNKSIDYGVSKDAKVIKTGDEYTSTITFKSIAYGFMKNVDVNGNSTTVDCYEVSFDDRFGSHNLVMCPGS